MSARFLSNFMLIFLSVGVNVIKVNLDKTKTSTTNLVTYGQTLKTKLTDLKNAVNTDLQGCSQQICIDLRTKVNNLQVNVDFSKVRLR